MCLWLEDRDDYNDLVVFILNYDYLTGYSVAEKKARY